MSQVKPVFSLAEVQDDAAHVNHGRWYGLKGRIKMMRCGMVLILAFALLGTSPGISEDFLLDDFSSESGVSAIGPTWRGFTDRVMGGISDATYRFTEIQGRRCLLLEGDVSLENQGGFVQVALSLEQDRRPFDASPYAGLRIWVLGNGETYYVHLRTRQTSRPWFYYQASFEAGARWQKVEIPFSQFAPENFSADLDPAQLTRVAVVAAKKAYRAEVAISRIEFYR
jgi:hypothetical protein